MGAAFLECGIFHVLRGGWTNVRRRESGKTRTYDLSSAIRESDSEHPEADGSGRQSSAARSASAVPQPDSGYLPPESRLLGQLSANSAEFLESPALHESRTHRRCALLAKNNPRLHVRWIAKPKPWRFAPSGLPLRSKRMRERCETRRCHRTSANS